MQFRPENKCSFCAKLFCCIECRIKHEIDVHFSLLVEVISCDLCNGSKGEVLLQQHNTDGFIDHLFMKHLPLQCRNCSVIFHNKVDLVTLHTCVSTKNIENDKLSLKMVLEGEKKIEPIIEEEAEQVNVAEEHCENVKKSAELLAIESGKQTSQSIDASVAENGSLIRSVSSVNNSENSNKTPLNNLVRQTSTPMTKMLHEAKGCYSMSASSIQMSSIENCSSEHDISPPLPIAPPINTFKQPSRRMPVAVTPYRQIMSRSIQRAISSNRHGRYVDSTPPLDLRTSPVIRRTLSIEGNVRPCFRGARSDVNTVDLRTTPVIRRTRQIEATNMAAVIDARAASRNETLNDYEQNRPSHENVRNSIQESLQKSSLSRSKSTNTFFETCRSFESSVTSSEPIAETPRTTGISKRSASFSSRQNMKGSKEDKEQWFTPSPETSENIPTTSTFKSPDDPSKLVDEDKHTDEVFVNEPNKGSLWSFVSSVLRLASLGGTADNNTVSNDNSDGSSLIKRCASFTGILPPRKPSINLELEQSPYKRRRTTTLSEIENKLGEDDNKSGRRGQRINGRPPIDRMRQS